MVALAVKENEPKLSCREVKVLIRTAHLCAREAVQCWLMDANS